MATVAVLQTDLILNSAAFRSGMVQAAATANSTLGSIRDQAASTASSLSLLSKAAVGLFAFEKVKEGIESLVETQVALQQVHYTLLSATGSAAVADETFQYLKETSTKLGLNLLDASKGFGQLAASAQASGIPLGQTKKLFEAFGEASTTLHLSTEQSTHALLALTEMMSAGTIHARQLNQQLGFAIPGSAARFKAAVMEAVKGTDLQGESFMHLMTEGKLVTSQFMPQLIQALQESGRGWESAVGGLNAQINLFSNAWLQLKNDVSGGLFNDAAIASVGFMANNLERLAAAATLVASVGVARLLGSGAQRAASAIVSPVVRYQQETLGAKMAASAEREHAESLVATALAEKEVVAFDQKGAAVTARSIALLKEQALAQQAVTAARIRDAEQALASAVAGHADILKVAPEYAASSEAQVVAAEKAVIAAKARHAEVEAGLNSLKAQGLAANNALVSANIALAASEDTVAAAQAKAAEAAAAEAVALGEGGIAGAAAKAGASLGRVALALVGGPWGAAALVVGAVAYSFYSLVESEKEAKKAIDEQVKSMDELRPHIQDTIAAYKELGSSMTDSSFLEQWKQANDTISTTEKKIATIKAQLANIADSPHVASPYGGLNANSFDDSRAKELKDELARLEATLAPTKAQFLEMSATLRTELGPAFDKVREQAEKVNEQDFDKFVASLDDATRRAIANADQLRTAFSQGFQSLQSMAENYQHQSEDFAKNDAEKAYNEVRRRALAIYQTNAPDSAKQAAVAALVKEGAAAIKAAEGYDRLKSAKSDEAKAATAAREQQQAYESLIATIQTRIDQDKEATGQQSKLTAAQALAIKINDELKKSTSKLSEAQKEYIRSLLPGLVAQGDARKASEEQQAADRNMLNLKRQLADEAQRQADANAAAVEGVGHGAQWNDQQRALEQITQAYNRRKEAADRAFKDETKGEQASKVQIKEHADAIALLDKAYAEATAAQLKFYQEEAAANAKWSNGFKAGIEDFMVAQQNNAARAKQMVTDLTSGFSDAFVQFVSGAKSARDAFGSMIDDMYKKALAFVADKAIQALFDSFSSFGGGGKTSTPGSSAGGWGSFLGNLGNAIRGGGSSGGFSFGPGTIGSGLASGGYAAPNSIHPVAENGPELLRVGGRTMLLMGEQGGQVVPNQQIGNAGSTTYVTNINVQPTSTRRTADQIAAANARRQRIAASRNG